MNVFEDLIIELKEENLLEITVMDAARNEPSSGLSPETEFLSDPVLDELFTELTETETQEAETDDTAFENLPVAMPVPEDSDMQLLGNGETVEIRKPTSEKEFFKKRAVGEVSSLQMVEHVLTAVEREHMKVVPSAYDDFEAKKALNAFLKVADDTSSDEHKEAEFRLMQETESWCSALADKDREISVANLRRYCENCRPMLSSQAMLSLARFYRNLPYSESVRGKFDFIITRLFSRPSDDQRRKLLFDRSEMLGHIQALYADWSSLSLYTGEGDESDVQLTAQSFEELTSEAEGATEFDELIKSDFFNRLRLFKESITELFFAPNVTVAAIECNIRVGNVYVELIARERQSSNSAVVHDRYSFIDDQEVSEATGRTLELVDLLRDSVHIDDHFEYQDAPSIPESDVETPALPSAEPELEPETTSPKTRWRPKVPIDKLGVNKWLLLVGMVIVFASAGLYVWANFFIPEPPSSNGVRRFDHKDTPFAEDVKIAKISEGTLYVVMMPSWETMTKEKQHELLKSIYQYGAGKDWTNVNLMNSTGKSVGFASPTRLDLVGP